MKRSLTCALCFSLALPALMAMSARPALAADGAERKPDFPSVEEALKIESAQIPIGYPRVTAGFHAGYSVIDSEPMARSIDGILEEFAVPSQVSLPEREGGVGFTLGIRASYRLDFDVETHWVTGTSIISTSYFGGLANVVLTPERYRAWSLAVGAGFGRQRIEMYQTYGISLPQNLTLSSVSYKSAWESVVPLAVTLELPNHRYSRYAVMFTVRYLIGDTRTESIPTGYYDLPYVPFDVHFGGWIQTIGLRVGL